MEIKNISIVFGPTLVTCASLDPLKLVRRIASMRSAAHARQVQEMAFQCQLVELLLTNIAHIFDAPAPTGATASPPAEASSQSGSTAPDAPVTLRQKASRSLTLDGGAAEHSSASYPASNVLAGVDDVVDSDTEAQLPNIPSFANETVPPEPESDLSQHASDEGSTEQPSSLASSHDSDTLRKTRASLPRIAVARSPVTVLQVRAKLEASQSLPISTLRRNGTTSPRRSYNAATENTAISLTSPEGEAVQFVDIEDEADAGFEADDDAPEPEPEPARGTALLHTQSLPPNTAFQRLTSPKKPSPLSRGSSDELIKPPIVSSTPPPHAAPTESNNAVASTTELAATGQDDCAAADDDDESDTPAAYGEALRRPSVQQFIQQHFDELPSDLALTRARVTSDTRLEERQDEQQSGAEASADTKLTLGSYASQSPSISFRGSAVNDASLLSPSDRLHYATLEPALQAKTMQGALPHAIVVQSVDGRPGSDSSTSVDEVVAVASIVGQGQPRFSSPLGRRVRAGTDGDVAADDSSLRPPSRESRPPLPLVSSAPDVLSGPARLGRQQSPAGYSVSVDGDYEREHSGSSRSTGSRRAVSASRSLHSPGSSTARLIKRASAGRLLTDSSEEAASPSGRSDRETVL